MHHAHNRKVNAYLDVPEANGPVIRDDLLDEDLYRLRSFSLTSKGKVLFDVWLWDCRSYIGTKH